MFELVERGEAGSGQEVKGIHANLKIWEFVPRAIGSHGRALSEGGPDSKVMRVKAAQSSEVA